MTELNDHAVEELLNRGHELSAREFVALVERHHPTEEPGVSRETLRAYAEAVAEEDDEFDPEGMLDDIDERLTDIEVWTEELYEVGEGRISAHAQEWHDDSDLNEQVLETVGNERRTLLPREVVEFVERYHPHDQPGIAWATLEAYAARFAEDFGEQFDSEEFLDRIESQLVETETWESDDALYKLDGKRVSLYPPRWHDRLGGSADLKEYLRFIADDAPGFAEERTAVGGSGEGVPEQFLLDTVNLVGRVDYETAKSRLEEGRDRGELAEDADQHPNARVRLAERTDDMQDSSLQS
ncbi:MAG TPA: hypothetical protein VFJ06_02300 [Halococcus sp.]|nr:hypothetical protein [Halococcus sp.]